MKNLLFLIHIRYIGLSGRPGAATINLWGQIIFDLLTITAIVHFAGSIQTFIAFTYLFHIVLACSPLFNLISYFNRVIPPKCSAIMSYIRPLLTPMWFAISCTELPSSAIVRIVHSLSGFILRLGTVHVAITLPTS